jgi:hypothetical protein
MEGTTITDRPEVLADGQISSLTGSAEQPLTTVFTPPASCRDRFYALATGSGEENAIASGRGDPLYDECQPVYGVQTYSPGVCPGHMALSSVVSIEKCRPPRRSEVQVFSVVLELDVFLLGFHTQP